MPSPFITIAPSHRATDMQADIRRLSHACPCLSTGSRSTESPAIPAQPAIACAAAPTIKTPMPEASPAFPIRNALTPARPLRRRRLSAAPHPAAACPAHRAVSASTASDNLMSISPYIEISRTSCIDMRSRSRVRSGSGPISMRVTTDLDAEYNRSRGGTRPISAVSWSPLTAVAAALTFTTAIGLVIPVFELAALGVAG